MKIMISNMIVIKNPTKEIKDFCIKELTFKNPEYQKKLKMGFYAYGTPKEIKLYDIYEDNLYVPTGFFNDLWKKHPYIDDYIDYSTSVPIEVTSNIKLRDYQEPAVRAVKENMCGIISMGCGMGKTCTCIQCICETKQKTLWIAGTIDLINQAKETAESLTSLKVSLITDGKCDTSGDMVCGTPQSIIKFIENGTLKSDMFGFVVQDECHHVSASPKSMQMFRRCIEHFASKYRVGLTATCWRSDGLEGCILKIMGGIIYNVEQYKDKYRCVYNNEVLLELPMNKFQVPAIIKVIETNYNIIDKPVYDKNGGTLQFASLITNISEDKERNDIIIKTLKGIEGSTIVLSDRTSQLDYLCDKVNNGVVVTGSTPKKVREKALNDMREGKIKYLFSTYQLAKEGLDIPILENLVMATPVKTFSTVKQAVGRCQRPYGNKCVARVYDFMDNVGMLYNFFNKRRSIYRKNNWDIENIYLGGD